MAHSADDQRARRARLMELSGAVRAYFEATTVGAGAGFWAAFDALRKNQPLAQAFVGDLEALLAYIDKELAPALSGALPQVQAPRAQPAEVRREPPAQAARPAPAAPPANINEDETMLLGRLPASVQKEVLRFEQARAGGAAASPAEDDEDDSL